MFEKAKPARDAFTFSLGGMTAVSPFVAMPVVADDRINRVRDQKLAEGQEERVKKPRGWLLSRCQAAHKCA